MRVSGEVPYALDSRMRSRSPPSVTRTIWRTLWCEKPSCDQLGVNPVEGSWGDAAHAAPHATGRAEDGCAPASSASAAAPAASGTPPRRRAPPIPALLILVLLILVLLILVLFMAISPVRDGPTADP
ncbi:hypothetical protein GCM10010388_33180 [Streptomyces mauvecolor]